MKNVMKNDVVKRVKDDIAEQLVRKEGWKYIPKKNKEAQK